jgi:hypothetical protein
MTTLIACDLDRTLIYTSSAIAESAANYEAASVERGSPIRVQRGSLICVEHFDGAPLSFMTTHSSELLRTLSTAAVFVPTTTRTVAQYRRVTLPGAPHRYAITTNGGNILVDGQPDPEWRGRVEERVNSSCAPLDQVTTELQIRIDDRWVKTLRTAEGLFCYLVVDLATLPTTFVADWSQWCADHNWTVSMQGRKIYSMPATLCKSIAIAEVRRRLESEQANPATVLAAGDGALDAEMLRYADAAIRPRHGELQAIGFQAPWLAVTRSTGIAAAAEILTWMSSAVANPMKTAAEPTQGAK